MNRTCSFIIGVLLLVGCGETKTPKQLASEHLVKAKELLAKQQFSQAKLQIDSIKMMYPNQNTVINEGVLLLNKVEVKEQKHSYHFLDSLLHTYDAEFVRLKKDFILKPGGVQAKSGLYVHKRQQVSNSFDRTFLKAYLSEKGVFYISSKYAGKSPIYHESVRVYDQGLFAETKAIPEDGIENRRYNDDGMYWETIHYRNGTDQGVADFIVNNFDKRLKVMYKGKKPFYIVMEKYDKEAIRDAYLLSKLFAETNELKQQLKNTQTRIEELEKEMSKISALKNQ